MEMYREMTTKILSQFLIGNVYPVVGVTINNAQPVSMCQFLIGNVYQWLV